MSPITAETALRLGIFFKMEPRYWLNLQSEYDIHITTREMVASWQRACGFVFLLELDGPAEEKLTRTMPT